MRLRSETSTNSATPLYKHELMRLVARQDHGFVQIFVFVFGCDFLYMQKSDLRVDLELSQGSDQILDPLPAQGEGDLSDDGENVKDEVRLSLNRRCQALLQQQLQLELLLQPQLPPKPERAVEQSARESPQCFQQQLAELHP